MSNPHDVLVVGGGAAGMMAAIVAAREGARVLVLERMQRVGKKLLATGNGRCNLTNQNADPSHFHGADPGFIRDALHEFGVARTLAFFEDLGILPRIEQDGKVFPLCDQASAVLDVLRFEMEELAIETICDTKAQRIEGREGDFICTTTDGHTFEARRVVVAAGGESTPNLGSSGGGFKIAAALGHHVVPTFPALVQVRLNAPFLRQLKGVSFDAAAEVRLGSEVRRRDYGEVLFTDYGLSGPPILHLSRVVSEFVEGSLPVTIHLDLFPGKTLEDLIALIRRRIEIGPAKSMETSFIGFVHKRLIPVLLKEAGIPDLRHPCATLTDVQIRAIASQVKDWTLRCTGTESWMHSQVTAGGVDVREVDPHTMESRIVAGIYFAGEVLDIDGDSGGYNLQWAWSSGYLAGHSAAAKR